VTGGANGPADPLLFNLHAYHTQPGTQFNQLRTAARSFVTD
jgi:hypothetical protein